MLGSPDCPNECWSWPYLAHCAHCDGVAVTGPSDTEFDVVTYADDEQESDVVERERLVEEYGATGDWGDA